MADLAGFKARFPNDFVYEPSAGAILDTTIQMFLDLAACEVAEYNFSGCWIGEATYLLTAHFLIKEVVNGASVSPLNGVTSRSIGDVSISFATPSDLTFDDTGYMSTRYGSRYLELRGRIPVIRFVSGYNGN